MQQQPDDQAGDLTKEAFLAWAARLGIDASREHLDLLYREVERMLGRLTPLRAIDVSEIGADEALVAPREA
jgi:hypothetical protein